MALFGSLPFALPFGVLTAVLYGLAYNPIVGMAAAYTRRWLSGRGGPMGWRA